MKLLQERNIVTGDKNSDEQIADGIEPEKIMKPGVIFDIDRYSIHDGHGIRCLIFMKGCPLRCRWCSNPEGQNFFAEMAYFPAKCIGCGACADSCSQNAIRMENGHPVTDWELCDNCGVCVERCYSGARRQFGTPISVQALFNEVKKDIVFFKNSGGGVTIGGGEVSGQPEFVREFLRKCKDENIHTAIETCGYCSWNALKGIADYTDLVFYDIKHMNPQKHKKITGFSNKRILQNLIKLSREAVDLLIRIPVIPKHNDDEANIKATAKFIVEELDLSHFKRVELLPYHRLGAFKYERLGRVYGLGNLEAPGDNEMAALKKMIESYGLTCQIGG
jgi:pyruvate formate lyase activating enzyme